jgi:hypothetical protein
MSNSALLSLPDDAVSQVASYVLSSWNTFDANFLRCEIIFKFISEK